MCKGAEEKQPLKSQLQRFRAYATDEVQLERAGRAIKAVTFAGILQILLQVLGFMYRFAKASRLTPGPWRSHIVDAVMGGAPANICFPVEPWVSAQVDCQSSSLQLCWQASFPRLQYVQVTESSKLNLKAVRDEWWWTLGIFRFLQVIGCTHTGLAMHWLGAALPAQGWGWYVRKCLGMAQLVAAHVGLPYSTHETVPACGNLFHPASRCPCPLDAAVCTLRASSKHRVPAPC